MPKPRKSLGQKSRLEEKVASDLAALGLMECPFCGVTFVRTSQRRVTCGGLVCRKQRETQLHRRVGGPGKGWSKGKSTIVNESTCQLCGVAFHCQQARMKRKGGCKFCSNNCRTAHLALNPSYYPQTRSRRGKGGKRADLGGKYFRSCWEANWARYLNFLIANDAIDKWEFEVDTFQFHEIKRGTRFYTPDFKVFNKDGTTEYHEIKGYMDQKSKTKLDRMAKYYPEIKVILIGEKQYKAVKDQVSRVIPGWEHRYQPKEAA